MATNAERTRAEVAGEARAALEKLDGIRKTIDSPGASPEFVRDAYAEWNTRALEVILRAIAC